MLSKVNGVFRLSQNPEIKYLPSGSSLAKLSLVNSSKYKTQSGEQKEESCFIDGTVFGKLAEVANQYLKKGSKIYVDAELKQETWKAQDGTNRSKHSLKVNSFEMLDSKQSQPKQENYQNEYQVPVAPPAQNGYNDSDEIPF